MIGKTEEVEKGLYLRRYGVPYEGIAHVLGHSAMYWYRATQALACIIHEVYEEKQIMLNSGK